MEFFSFWYYLGIMLVFNGLEIVMVNVLPCYYQSLVMKNYLAPNMKSELKNSELN